MRSVTGKTAFITGGANGIGLAMARAFSGAGMGVALADVDATRLDDAAAELRESGAMVATVVLDVADLQQWTGALNAVEAGLGPISVLCNNAGIGLQGLLHEADPQRWRRVVEVNLMGTFNGCHALLPRLLARGDEAHIVNTASLSGLRSNAGMSAYDASKAAVVGLSDTLRAELAGSPVGLSVVYPGLTKTQFVANSERLNASGDSATANALKEGISGMLAQGLSPDAIGQRVLQAILANEYHVFTHPRVKPQIEAHFQERLDAFGIQTKPALPDAVGALTAGAVAAAHMNQASPH